MQKFDEWFFGSAPTSSLFSFDVQDRLSHNWRPVLKWGVDGDLPIQREQVKFVTDSIVYAFGNAHYMVTTDGGNTWSDWDAMKALPDPKLLAIIKKVSVSGRQIVYKESISLNRSPGSNLAPAFLFVRSRTQDDPAVTRIP